MKRQKLAPIFTKAKRAKVESDEESSKEEEGPIEWKFLAWNVAGIRAWVKKKGHVLAASFDADIVFLGETKCTELPVEVKTSFKGYHSVLVNSVKNGYAGVAMLSKTKPMSVQKGIGDATMDEVGRLIVAEFPSFFFVGAYVPNSGRGLVNLDKRGEWEELMREKVKQLDKQKPVIYGGDLNVAHEEIDLANPKANANKTAGFTDQERGDMTKLLDCGLVDTFRKMHGNEVGAYTFWSYMSGARSRNVGWRLDYFLVSTRVADDVISSEIVDDPKQTSDHTAITLTINI